MVGGVVSRHKKAGAPVVYHVAEATDRGGDDRRAARLRLEGDETERLRPRRDEHDVRGRVEVDEAGLGLRREQDQPILHAERGGQPEQPIDLAAVTHSRRATHDREHEAPLRVSRDGLGQRANSDVGPLVRLETAHVKGEAHVGEVQTRPGLRLVARTEQDAGILIAVED